MDDLPQAPDSRDDTGVGSGRGSTRHRRRWAVALVILAKVGIAALILVLPSGLAISLGAAHGVALLALLVSAAVALGVYKRRGKTPRPALSHRAPYGHGFVTAWGRRMFTKMLKNRGSK